MAKVLILTSEGGDNKHFTIECPGCEMWHSFDRRWTFNNDLEKPTFSPSLLVNGSMSKEELKNSGTHRCHSFVRNGNIEFLADCSHKLASKTVPLEDIE